MFGKSPQTFVAQNHFVDLLQKHAWRLVRSAEDRFPAGNGADKMNWCVGRLAAMFVNESKENLEDFVRAAYINFKIETGDYNLRRALKP